MSDRFLNDCAKRPSIIDRVASDRGIAMPIFALFMTVMFAAMAFTIDLGNGWRTRRSLIPATDAAALAAAQDYASGVDGCSATAGSYLVLNEPAAVMDSCTAQSSSSSSGMVTVAASHNVQTFFMALLGMGDYQVVSSTTAAWGPPSAVNGLRPLGLCVEGSTELQQVVYNPPANPTDITVWYNKEQPSDCGDTTGNWGVIDLDGDSNAHNDLVDWLANGYPDEVFFSDHPVTSCTGEPHCYEGDTGADLAGAQPTLDALVTSGEYFTIPLFNFVEDPGGNAMFHLIGLVRVQLLDHRVVGNEDQRFLTFRVYPGFVTGSPGGSGSGTGGNKVISICAVDGSSTSGCVP